MITKPNPKENHDLLIRWLDSNEPIDRDNDDLFDMGQIAQRIANRLSEAKTFGIVGPYGSGKSSLRKLIDRRLEQNGIWSCLIEGWGFDPIGAPERVLHSVVDLLSQYVDAMAIAGLPSRYTAALRASGSTFAGVASELLPTPAGQSLLELDRLLAAVNHKLVIFLEDLDRNSNPATLESIAPLLDRLRPLNQLTFVLAIQAAPGATTDLIRLCDYIEVVRPLSSSTVGTMLDSFQSICLSAFPQDVDPVGLVARAASIFKADAFAALIRRARSGNTPSPLVVRLAKLLDTPRKLKSAFR